MNFENSKARGKNWQCRTEEKFYALPDLPTVSLGRPGDCEWPKLFEAGRI